MYLVKISLFERRISFHYLKNGDKKWCLDIQLCLMRKSDMLEYVKVWPATAKPVHLRADPEIKLLWQHALC